MNNENDKVASLEARIQELENDLNLAKNLIESKDQMIRNLFQERTDLYDKQSRWLNGDLITFGTRNQYGVTKEYGSLYDAVQEFVGYEGYRLDIVVADEMFISIHRDELPIANGDMSVETITNLLSYQAKVVIQKSKE